MSRQDKLRSGEFDHSKILEARRNQILEELSFADVSSFIDATDDANKALKGEYNQLSHELETLQSELAMDPLAILPPEIWTDIIREATNKNDINLSATDALLLLTLVNNQWRTKILKSL